MTKRCTDCKTCKAPSEFYKNPGMASGFLNQCKTCVRARTLAYQRTATGRKVHSLSDKKYSKSPEIRARRRIYQRVRGQNSARKAYLQVWRCNRGNKLKRQKYQSDAAYRLSLCMSRAINKAIRLVKNGRRWENLLGYTGDALRTHLESKFLTGMCWGNYGSVWHIDHIIPISFFKYQTPEEVEFRYCWSLPNLMPRFATNEVAREFGSMQEGNLNKQAKVIGL